MQHQFEAAAVALAESEQALSSQGDYDNFTKVKHEKIVHAENNDLCMH